jgi:hypothetical protein
MSRQMTPPTGCGCYGVGACGAPRTEPQPRLGAPISRSAPSGSHFGRRQPPAVFRARKWAFELPSLRKSSDCSRRNCLIARLWRTLQRAVVAFMPPLAGRRDESRRGTLKRAPQRCVETQPAFNPIRGPEGHGDSHDIQGRSGDRRSQGPTAAAASPQRSLRGRCKSPARWPPPGRSRHGPWPRRKRVSGRI